MVYENIKPIIENKKPTETVYELKDEIPSWEEFEKSYENDGNLNYEDLKDGNIGEIKGYGPCTNRYSSCGNFSLNIGCHSYSGNSGGYRQLNSVGQAWTCVEDLEGNRWEDSEWISDEVLFKCARLVRDAIIKHNTGQSINGHISVQGRFWGGPSWKYSY